MIIDKELVFFNDEAAYGDTESASVDLVKAGGVYDNAWLFVKVGSEVFNTMTSMNIVLQTSDDDFAADTVELLSVNKLLTEMDTINTVLIKVRVPLGIKQYLRVYATAIGTDNTTGKLYAAIVPDVNEGF